MRHHGQNDSGANIKQEEALRRISNSPQNVVFQEIRSLAEAFGFRLSRVSGSHHVFTNRRVRELLNLQEIGGEAKPYQVRQFLRLVERYNLTLEDET